ncbi:MAG: hypothetical protein IPO21_01995 [Bacteroidales bacterium]|nr:hypothetical protein [Bacteroidales bacterium]
MQVQQVIYFYKATKQANNLKKDSLLQKLDSLERVYLSTVADNEGLIAERDSALKKIDKLRASVNRMSNDSRKLKDAEILIAGLQQTAMQYVKQLDSLIVLNKQLTEQNTQLSTEVEEIKKVDAEKTQQLEQLSVKVEKAQQLKAFNVISLPLAENSKPKFKAKKVAKIKTSATIGENVVIDPGKKEIYMRITRSDGAVLSSTADNSFTYEGEKIMFTEMKEIDYNNKEVNVDIFYKANDDITPGTYKIVLFHDGKEIGNTSFVLN